MPKAKRSKKTQAVPTNAPRAPKPVPTPTRAKTVVPRRPDGHAMNCKCDVCRGE